MRQTNDSKERSEMADTVENSAGVQVAVEPGQYFNNLTGKYESGVRDPDTHVVTFGKKGGPTDAAQARAAELGVVIAEVTGSGKDGRVTVQDVEAHHTATQQAQS
jgi:pyruvate/2-oxoglutarate dehydrogenase complex dihydrolipoamide acyltransferase (E2) component